jgi:hypothetical protein
MDITWPVAHKGTGNDLRTAVNETIRDASRGR